MIPLALSFSRIDPTSVVLWLAAWFVTIGLHEGSHAWVAWWLGDDTSYLLGKRTMNPVKHIDLNDRNSIICTIVLPVVSTLAGFLPMGLAWVPVNPNKFRHPTRDMAITSLAGPGGNLLGMLLGAAVFVAAVAMGHRLEGNVAIMVLRVWGIYMMVLNLLLAFINLLPIPGVDGGAVAYYFMNWRGREIYDNMRPYGLMILLFVGFLFLGPVYQRLMEFAGITLPDWLEAKLFGGGNNA
jgi:Zn-dependent protease